MPTRWHCPPESWWGSRSAWAWARPTSSRSSRARAARARPRSAVCVRNGSAIDCSIVSRGFNAATGFWKTMPVLARRRRSVWLRSPLIGSPSMLEPPDVGSISRSAQRATVLFPDPDSPTRPKVVPASTSKETPSTARTSLPCAR